MTFKTKLEIAKDNYEKQVEPYYNWNNNRIAFIGYYQIPFSKSNGGRLIGGTLSIVLRILSCVWISKIAKAQGRKAIGFIILAIIIPAITLIIMGVIGDKEKVERI